MKKYKLYVRSNNLIADAVMLELEDGSTISFQFNPDNPDYQAYLKWLAEGNTPEPADSTP
jgi:hypothetical protein